MLFGVRSFLGIGVFRVWSVLEFIFFVFIGFSVFQDLRSVFLQRAGRIVVCWGLHWGPLPVFMETPCSQQKMIQDCFFHCLRYYSSPF